MLTARLSQNLLMQLMLRAAAVQHSMGVTMSKCFLGGLFLHCGTFLLTVVISFNIKPRIQKC